MAQAEQECHRYYEAWLAAHGSPGSVSGYLASLAELEPGQDEHQSLERLRSRDRTLIAFAQNVVFRLQVRRCMISLIDAAHQYVLGEATHSQSTICPDGSPGDEIWLGTAVLARPDAMCEHSLDGQCEARDREHGTYKAEEGMIVNDCRADPRFAGRPYVMQNKGPRVRFYAGVPLVTRAGYKIGVLAATDENPRDGLSVQELSYMQDMAQCAIAHLEWARDRVDRFKGERMVRGMASFIADSSLRCSAPQLNPDPTMNNTATAPGQEQDENSAAMRSSSSQPRGRNWRRVRRLTESNGGHREEDEVIKSAARILQQCALADGCIVLSVNAQVGSGPPMCRLLAESPTASLGTHLQAAGPRVPSLQVDTLYAYSRTFPRGCMLSCTASSVGVSLEDDEHTNLRPRNERRGASSTTSISTSRSNSSSRDFDHQELLRQVPEARTAIFMPLFDSIDEKLLAGVLVWSRAPGRMENVYLSHMRAFASCIASELKRVDMQRDEAAKSTFIASMSHELRTPLHGILGAAEFLLDSAASAYDMGLVKSIITCGKTLLGTLNHVLDHSKINHLDQPERRSDSPYSGSVDNLQESMSLTADVDLGILVEEAAEVVTVGHTFRSVEVATTYGSTAPSFDSLTSQSFEAHQTLDQGVTVLLDITAREDWMVTTQPGAVSRIVMNLLGNAFKYTSSGFVAVSLRALTHPGDAQVSVLMRFVDSGKGMSEDFVRRKLALPFCQEDPFQPGVGLGFSIVKQLVDMLGGSIDVQSTLHQGTQVDVHLTLQTATSHAPVQDAFHPQMTPSEICHHPLAVAANTVGKKLVLLDPLDPERIRSATHQASRFQQTLRQTCEEWFGMRVVRETEMDLDNDVAMYLYGEPPSIEMLRRHKRPDRDRKIPVILACQNDHDAISVIKHQQQFLAELGQIVEVIQQPCGPQKLARVFAYCLKKADEMNITLGDDEIIPPSRGGEAQRSSSRQDHVNSESSFPENRPKLHQELRKSVSAATTLATGLPLDPTTPELRDSSAQGDTSLNMLVDSDGTESIRKASSTHPPSLPNGRASLDGLHVLLVDDNKLNRQLLVIFMKKCGFTFEQAENGQEAIDLFTAAHSNTPPSPTHEAHTSTAATTPADSPDDLHAAVMERQSPPPASSPPTKEPINSNDSPQCHRRPFDYIFMDISMPIMNGTEATRRIRALEVSRGISQGRRVKIFAITGLASEKTREEVELAGFDRFLTKPVRFAELKALMT